MRTISAVAVGVLVAAGCAAADQPASLDQIAPTISQLGAGWTSNHVVVLVDQLSPTNEVCNEGPGWVQAAHNVVGKRGCEAYAVFRYYYGSASILVWIKRFRSRQDVGDDWGKDKETKTTPDNLPKVGDEVRFYQRHGLHNDIEFWRGKHLVTVEGVSAPMEKLKQLAEALDRNLVKTQENGRRSESAATQFVAEGSVDYYNSWSAEDVEARRLGITPVVSNTMNFTVTVSNSCYLMRLVPAKQGAALYQEAGFDGETLYYVNRLNLSSLQNAPGFHAGLNVANAWIFDQQRVVHSLFAHEMGPVWLMFASGDYLRRVTNGLVEPPVTLGLFENLDYYPRPFEVPAQWTLQEAFPFLPLRVTCQDDGETKTEPPFQNARREPPFDAGFTNIVFRVTGTRKSANAEVPCAAELDTYRPALRGKPELRPYTRYRLTLTKWSKGIPPTSFRPKLPGFSTISDTRSSAAGPRASVRADKWPAEEQRTKGDSR